MMKAKMIPYCPLPPLTKKVDDMLDEYCSEVLERQNYEVKPPTIFEDIHIHQIITPYQFMF
jgi:hypothetical protein